MKARYEAVLMVGFGGPTRPDEIRPFLQNVARGRPIPPARLEEVAHHYQAIGGRSPYNELIMKQADALRALLAEAGAAVPVYVGMRNWAPYVKDVIREIAGAGARRIFCFPMAPHRSEASWDRYRQTVAEALADVGSSAPAAGYPEPWHDHPLFVRAVASRVADSLESLTDAERSRVQVIFTAHSIPAAMDAQSRYSGQIAESCCLVARQLGLERWTLAYQSRSGKPRDPWLEPDVSEVLRGLAGRSAVVAPVGFICDHVEVLYDLDIETASIARASGVTMRRAATVGDHPLFIRMIAELLGRARIADGGVSSAPQRPL
jgi:ferrochelatase